MGSGLGEALSWWRVLSIAAVVGLLGGAVELGVLQYVLAKGLPLHLSREYVWMTPVADLLVAVTLGCLLIGVGRFWRGAASRPVVVGICSGLVTVGALLSIEFLHPAAVSVVGLAVGFQLGRLSRGRFGEVVERVAPSGALGLGAVVAVTALVSLTVPSRAEARVEASAPAAEGSPNVLLLILDTVRARSMGLYAAGKGNTPVTEALGRDGVVFDHAYSAAPWTLPSHATMFTGTWPQQHGADWLRPLDDRLPTLAEVLAERGYATAGFVGNLAYANHNFGLDRGFTRFEDYPVSFWQIVFSSGLGRRLASMDGLRRVLGLDDELNRVPAAEVTDRFLRWHDGRVSGRPYFAFLNYFDAHEPLKSLVDAGPVVPLTYRNSLVTGESIHFQIPPGRQDRFFDVYRKAYEAAIGEMDHEVGRLLASLKADGDLDNTLVIVTSDHGELIGEYDLFGHESSLYQPTLWVPLVMRLPGRVPSGTHVGSPVSTRNLAATILDLADQAGTTGPGAGPPDPIPGRSLAALWGPDAGGAGAVADGDPTGGEEAYAYLRRGPSPRVAPWAPVVRGPYMESVIDGSMQYIRNGDGTEELYPVGVDPSRAVNLAADSAMGGRLRDLRIALAELWGMTAPGLRGRPRMGGTPQRIPAMP